MKRSVLLAFQVCLIRFLFAQDGGDRLAEQKPGDTSNIHVIISRAIERGAVDTSAADSLFRRAIKKAIKSNDPYNAGRAYYAMGEMYFRFKNHNKSFGGFFNAKEFFIKAGSRKEIAYTNFALGRQQYYRGNYKISAGHLNYAMREAKQLQLKELESNVLEYMGVLYHVMPSPRHTSSHVLRKALEIKQNLKDSMGSLQLMKTLGDVYYSDKKFDSALYFNNAAIGLARKLGLMYDVSLIQLEQVPSLLRLNKLNEAVLTLQNIYERVLDTSDLNMRIRYYIQAGNYRIAKQDTGIGRQYYDSALDIARKAGFPEMYSLVYKGMADAYYSAGDFQKAYEYQREYTNKMAGLYSADNYSTLRELQAILKTNIKEDEVKYLSALNEIAALRLKNERSLRITLSISAAGFLLSAIIIFLLYKQQKRKSVIIEKQGSELQTLMKEIHHRVKNNLQVISSLLDLQSQTMGDVQAAEAIKESRNRVQTMALIHQDLYSEGSLSGIEISDYINKLAQSLFSSYNVKKNTISLETNIEPMLLDIDLVIPIGLVLNELISNALKYAFANRESGTLIIELEKKSAELILKVKDDGIGFPAGLNIYQAKSFGYKLVKAFAQKLKARLEVYNDNGACVLLHIRKYKIM
jgi:two-component sensor histidine kinase